MENDDILCGLYADICSDVSDDSETENLNIDSYISTTSSHKQSHYISTTSSHKQSQSCSIVLTSKSVTSTVKGRM
jgi:hypothetical protein